MSKQSERESILLRILQNKQKLSTLDAMEVLNVSESTARRLFGSLEQQGKVIRQYGGIQLANQNQFDYSFEHLMSSNQEEKQAIASSAVSMISDRDVVFFDSGTTVYQLCLILAETLRTGSLSEITVFTNSLANLQVLSPVCAVILIGGEYRPKRMDFAGYASNKFISHFHFSKAFIGADGISLSDGYMTTDSDTASLDESAISRSDQVIVLADSGKLGRRSFVSYASMESAQKILTGSQADPAFLKELESRQIEVITCG